MATFLVVDDHPTFRTAARLVLEAGGHAVVGEAGSARGALAAARDLRPEVVLLDVDLPDLDGFEVAARLTSAGDGPVVVIVSSQDPADLAPRLERSGARGFIPKAELSAERVRALDL